MELASSGELSGIITVAACLILSACFSGAETAISSLGPLKARHIRDMEKRGGRSLSLWIEQPSRVLSTILIGNNIVNILASAIITEMATRYFQSYAVGVATGAATLLVLVFGEIIPKSFAQANADRLAVPALHFVYVIYFLIYPLVVMFAGVANRFVRILGGSRKSSPLITEDELQFLVNIGGKSGAIEETKRTMMAGIFDFGETRVREIMTPRTEIKWLRSDCTLEEALELATSSKFSRIPVAGEGGIDNVAGILLVKDLLEFLNPGKTSKSEKTFNVMKFTREPLFVPESRFILDLFKDLKRSRNHLAIVVDEHGGTAGLVTMEDLLEEIVGEIQDEHDCDETKIKKIKENTYLVDGTTYIYEFLEFFQLDVESLNQKPAEGVGTVGGWISSILGKVPEKGTTLQVGPFDIKITEASHHRIIYLEVLFSPEKKQNQSDEPAK